MCEILYTFVFLGNNEGFNFVILNYSVPAIHLLNAL